MRGGKKDFIDLFFLLIFFIIFIVPIFLFMTSSYIKAQDTDYGYTKAEATVDYHIYKPEFLPKGLDYATKFISGKELAGKQTAVQVVYDTPFDELIKNERSEPIVVKQVGVGSEFDLDMFAATFVKDVNPQKLP